MIKEEVFSQEWLQRFRNDDKYRRINPPVFDKMIYALLLLDKLAESNLDFIFKGGTSLVLLLDDADRFSIDIDIMTTNSKEDIDRALAGVVKTSRFTGYEYDQRRSATDVIPKAHYKIFYESPHDENANILLDVLFEENSYPNILRVPISCSWISTEEPVGNVSIPCVNSILGDKLTAFAPNTTGIPYAKGKHIEIIKQLHDIDRLIDKADDLSTIKYSFDRIAAIQIGYRGLGITPNEVCDDIINTALLIARRDKNTGADKERMAEINRGIDGFASYLMHGSFRIDDAIAASAKAALLATKIKHHDLESIKLYDNDDLTGLDITNVDYNFLNRFKRTNRSAFHYWFQALNILGIE